MKGLLKFITCGSVAVSYTHLLQKNLMTDILQKNFRINLNLVLQDVRTTALSQRKTTWELRAE